MAKELPYFKFYISDWINGDITLESYEAQGLFTNICAYYWSKDCDLTLINLKKKFRGSEDLIDLLISSGIIKIKSGIVFINFLIEQLKSKEVQVITNRINGLKGGRPRKEETEEKPNGFIFDNRNETEIITETKPKDNPIKTNIKESKVKDNDEGEKPSSTSSIFSLKMLSSVKFGINEFTRYACSQTKRTEQQLIELMQKFISEQKALSKLSWPSEKDAKAHFINWVKKQPSPNAKPFHLQRPAN